MTGDRDLRVASLHTYPVKGCHRLDHDAAGIEACGLTGDRRWMLVDPDGVGITQRSAPALTRLRAEPAPPGSAAGITLRADGLPALDVPAPVDGPETTVRVFRSKPPVPARVAADNGWCERLLGRPAHLVWLADPAARPVAGHPDARVSLADGHPILLATTASLAALNDWLAEDGDEPVPMTRFRPNVVVSGAAPWAEDSWLGGRLRIGDNRFRAVRACDRCTVATIDQETGEAGRQPLRVLGRRRRTDQGLPFGIYLIPDIGPGQSPVVRVGDTVHPEP